MQHSHDHDNETLFTHLSHYCERAGQAGYFAEPLNLISNIAFVIAAFLIFHQWRKSENISIKKTADILVLTVILAAIGVGSGLWHLLANSWSLLADVIPIVLFIHIFLASALIRLFRIPIIYAIIIVGLFLVFGRIFEEFFPPHLLNGSIIYVPTYFALCALTLGLYLRRDILWKDFIFALLVFTASLTARTLDQAICDQFAIGVHFAWHLLNALLLYILLRALLKGVLHMSS